jgi:cytochrome c-type biogenesis protein CcmF
VRFDQLWGRDEPQRQVIIADVSVLSGSRVIGRMQPRLNFYRTQQQPVPTPAVRSRPAGDLYLNLMAFEETGKTATLRVIVEPLVPWIWLGGAVVCLGAIISLAPNRRRVFAARAVPGRVAVPPPVRPTTAPAPVATQSLEGAQS